MIVKFHQFKYDGLEKAQWAVKDINDKRSLIFQFFSPHYSRKYEEALFNASKAVWDKVDVGYTDEVEAYDIIMSEISPGAEMALVKMVLKNLGLKYELITNN